MLRGGEEGWPRVGARSGVAPGEAGPITVPGSGRRPGEVRLRGGAGRPVRAPSLDFTDLLHIGFSPPPTGGGSRAEAMTSSQRPEVVECKKLPTCDRKKREREGEGGEKKKKTLPRLLSMPGFLPLPRCWLPLPREPRNRVVCAATVWLRILFSQRSGF